MMNKPTQSFRVLICGTGKNIESHLENFVRITNRSFRYFASVEYLICESFSTDDTWKALEEKSRRMKGFHVIQDTLIDTNEPLRTVRIASARRIIQEYVRKRRTEYDYVVMIDLDGVNRSLNDKSVSSCWNYSNWDVATANQPFRYYDLWALRTENWLETDIWEEIAFKKSNVSQRQAKKILKKYYRSIPRTSSPIQVTSAFGGLAIYKTEAFLAGSYSGVDKTGAEICEHVQFHQELCDKGFKIYIVPSLVNINRIDQAIHIISQNVLGPLRRIRSILRKDLA